MDNQLQRQFQNVRDSINCASNVFIASHENPDADAVASVLSLHLALGRKGIKSSPYLPELPPKRFSFLPSFFNIKDILNFRESPDFLICLDCGDFKRLRVGENFPEDKIITIDHHPKADQRGFLKIIRPEFSSTSEIIYLLLKETKYDIDRDIATCLLAGIIADSGGFQYVSTSSVTFRIVAELLQKGALLEKIMNLVLFSNKPLNILKMWGLALSRIRVDERSGLVYSWVDFNDLCEYGVTASDLAGIPSVLSTTPGADLALFLVEYEKGRVKGSLRMENFRNGATINIAQIAETLSGGGHPYASGFKQEGSIEEVLNKVYKLIG